ncbi:hypothetical protein EON80_13870, partial [bacterium]
MRTSNFPHYSLGGLAALWVTLGASCPLAQAAVQQNKTEKTVTLTDDKGQLSLRLNYSNGCVLDQITVRGRQVGGSTGTTSGVQVGGEWFTTRSSNESPKVNVNRNLVTVKGIAYGKPGAEIREDWSFRTQADRIVWKIDRTYPGEVTLDDTAFPQWNFASMDAWTGGILGNGGVVWNKYLENPNSTYGAHTDAVTLWNREKNDALRIIPTLS